MLGRNRKTNNSALPEITSISFSAPAEYQSAVRTHMTACLSSAVRGNKSADLFKVPVLREILSVTIWYTASSPPPRRAALVPLAVLLFPGCWTMWRETSALRFLGYVSRPNKSSNTNVRFRNSFKRMFFVWASVYVLLDWRESRPRTFAKIETCKNRYRRSPLGLL